MTDFLPGFQKANSFESLMQYGTPKPALGSGLTGLDISALTLPTASVGTTPTAVTDPSFMQSLLGYKNADGTGVNGWGSPALGALSGIANIYMGMKNYGLARDQLTANQGNFEKNYAAQKQATNASLEDRQAARVASNPTAYQSVSEYMSKYGIK